MFCVQNNLVGQRVRLARLGKSPKMTQLELAKKLQLAGWDITRGGVAKIEAGVRGVSDIELSKLAKALGVTAGWLMSEAK